MRTWNCFTVWFDDNVGDVLMALSSSCLSLRLMRAHSFCAMNSFLEMLFTQLASNLIEGKLFCVAS